MPDISEHGTDSSCRERLSGSHRMHTIPDSPVKLYNWTGTPDQQCT